MFCFPGGDAPQARKARKVIANADRTTAPQRGPAVSRIPERYGVTEALRYLSDLSRPASGVPAVAIQFALAYSCLSEAMGSSLAARRAGQYDAAKPTASRIPAVSSSVVGSAPRTPNSRLSTKRARPMAATSPSATPLPTRIIERPRIKPMTAPRCAPSAIRKPISPVRRETSYAVNPYSPKQTRMAADNPMNPRVEPASGLARPSHPRGAPGWSHLRDEGVDFRRGLPSRARTPFSRDSQPSERRYSLPPTESVNRASRQSAALSLASYCTWHPQPPPPRSEVGKTAVFDMKGSSDCVCSAKVVACHRLVYDRDSGCALVIAQIEIAAANYGVPMVRKNPEDMLSSTASLSSLGRGSKPGALTASVHVFPEKRLSLEKAAERTPGTFARRSSTL